MTAPGCRSGRSGVMILVLLLCGLGRSSSRVPARPPFPTGVKGREEDL